MANDDGISWPQGTRFVVVQALRLDNFLQLPDYFAIAREINDSRGPTLSVGSWGDGPLGASVSVDVTRFLPVPKYTPSWIDIDSSGINGTRASRDELITACTASDAELHLLAVFAIAQKATRPGVDQDWAITQLIELMVPYDDWERHQFASLAMASLEWVDAAALVPHIGELRAHAARFTNNYFEDRLSALADRIAR